MSKAPRAAPIIWRFLGIEQQDELLAFDKQENPQPLSPANINSYLVNGVLAAGDADTQQLRAYVVMRSVAVTTGELLQIVVARHWRGSGLADDILHEAIDQLPSGCEMLWLEVRRRNTIAQGFYRRFGFTEDGIRKKYYPASSSQEVDDALLMSLDLRQLSSPA